MNFYCNNHQGKANLYIHTLKNAGYKQVEEKEKADFLLIDIDILSRASLIKEFQIRGKPVFMYPHTARPVLQWDGWYTPSPHVTAIFTIAKGGADIPHKYGYDLAPIHPVGWTFCDLHEFRPCENPKKILFAPIHVNGNGFLTHRETATNAKVFHRLLGLPDVEITVRYLYELEGNGLWEEPNVTYVQGEPNQSVEDIERADVVVSHQNMAYLAIARGKPTLMMAEHLPPISGNTLHNVQEVASWDLYKDDLMFPHDILASDDTWNLILDACRSDVLIADWKKKYIGDPFNPELFLTILESYL